MDARLPDFRQANAAEQLEAAFRTKKLYDNDDQNCVLTQQAPMVVNQDPETIAWMQFIPGESLLLEKLSEDRCSGPDQCSRWRGITALQQEGQNGRKYTLHRPAKHLSHPGQHSPLPPIQPNSRYRTVISKAVTTAVRQTAKRTAPHKLERQQRH